MRRLFAVGLILCACAVNTDDDLADSSEALFAAGGEPFWYPKVIPVCWENFEDRSVENWDAYRAWVRDAAQSTWGLHGQISFTGWGACRSDSRGIRIRVADQREHTLQVGSVLDGVVDGMSLNFNFQNDTPRLYCQTYRYTCIRSAAIHEFGHALGFLHEQDRPDNNGRCTDSVRTITGVYLTDYDPSSVMNYCASGEYVFLNPTELSYLDTVGIQRTYGWPTLTNQFPGGWPTMTRVAAASRARGFLSVFRVGSDGRVYTSEGWHRSGGASEWMAVGTFAGFPQGAKVTALARDPHTIDLFAVATDGQVYRTWRDFRQASWNSWRRAGAGTFPPGSLVRAIARSTSRLDLFVNGYDNGVYHFPVSLATGLCMGCPTAWSRIGNLVTYAPVAVIMTEPNEMQIFAKDASGAVFTAYRLDNTGWYSWFPVPGVTSWPYTPVAVAVRPNKIDLFVAGTSGGITLNAFVRGVGWSGWTSLGGPNIPYWADVEALARHADAVDLFATATDGSFQHNWLDMTTGGQGTWRGWHALTSTFEGAQSYGAPVTALAHPEGHVRNPYFLGQLTGWTVTVNGVSAPEQAALVSSGSYVDVQIPATPASVPRETVLSQWITIPRLSPQLRLYYTTPCTDPDDHFRIELRDSYGNVLLQPVAPTCTNNLPRPLLADVSAVAGRTVELRMIHRDDGDATPTATTIASPVQIVFWSSLDTWQINTPAKGENEVFVVDNYGRLLNSAYDEL